MGLFNPILGNIPQPEANSKEVAFKELPRSNYGATTTTPQTNILFCETLETSNDQTDTYTTLKPLVITHIIVQGRHLGTTTGTETATVDISLNGITLLSLNLAVARSATYPNTNSYNYDIPLEYVLIPANSLFKMISDRITGDGGLYFNCSIIGYEYTKQ